MQDTELVVRVNRLLLLVVLFFGVLFFWFGSDILIFKQVFSGNETTTIDRNVTVTTSVNENAKWLAIIPMLLGAILIYTMVPYIIKPPTMLHVTEHEVIFGTNMKYVPYSIPRKYIKAVRLAERGVAIEFTSHEDVPAQLTTSAGIMYSLHQLSLSQLYMNKSATSVVSYFNKN